MVHKPNFEKIFHKMQCTEKREQTYKDYIFHLNHIIRNLRTFAMIYHHDTFLANKTEIKFGLNGQNGVSVRI